MKLNDLVIKEITVLKRPGYADIVYVTISGLKAPIWPYDQPLVMHFEAASGKGQQFVSEAFGMLARVIDW